MSLEADIHRCIRQDNRDRRVLYQSPYEMVSELEGINVSFISVLADMPKGFRRGAYALLSVDTQSITPDIIEKLGTHILRRFLPENTFQFPGYINIAECVNVQSTEYTIKDGPTVYPIFKIIPSVYNPENDMRDANN